MSTELKQPKSMEKMSEQIDQLIVCKNLTLDIAHSNQDTLTSLRKQIKIMKIAIVILFIIQILNVLGFL